MKFIRSFLVFLIGITFFSYPLRAQATNIPAVIRFGEVATGGRGKPTGAGLVSIAKAEGFFDEEFGKDKIDIEEIYFPGAGTAVTEALDNGDIDFGGAGGICNIIGLAGKIPARIVAVSHGMIRLYLAVHPNSPVKKVEDLRHLRVAGQRGTNADVLLAGLLAAHGLREEDVVYVNLESAKAMAAFNAGAVDAVIGGVGLLILRDRGYARILADTSAIDDPEGHLGATLVTNRFETAYPEITQRVVKVLTKAAWWASLPDNREALINFQSQSGIPRRYYEEEYTGDNKGRYDPLIDAATRESYRKLVGFAVEHKLVQDDKYLNFDNWFETKYLDHALHELKLENFWAPKEVARKEATSR